MTFDNHSAHPHHHPISARWRLALRVYNKINRISHHLLSISVKFLMMLSVLFCLLFLVLRFALIPQVGNYQPEIERMLSSSLGRSVSVSQVIGSWRGLRPHLELREVTIHDKEGQNALVLPNVQVTVSWLSLLLADVRLYSLEINSAELELKRSADGKIYVAGWWIDPAEKSDSRGLNWILKQRSIVIRNGTLKWTDQQRAAATLTLSDVNFVMKNQWLRHQFSLTATPPVNLAKPLDIRADFKHHPFSENISDFSKWQGQLYADFSNADLAAWKSYVDYPFDVQQGTGGVRFWFLFDQGKIVDITADLKLTDVNAQLENNLKGDNLQRLHLKTVSGRISAQEIVAVTNVFKAKVPDTASLIDRFHQHGHQLALTNFTFETDDGMRLPPTTLTERFIPAHKNKEALFQFSTQFLDLTVLAKLAEYFPLPNEYRELLKTAQPSGSVSHFSVRLQGNYPAISQYQIMGGFTNLTMKSIRSTIKPTINATKSEPPVSLTGLSAALSKVPGFSNLTGHININEKKGSIQLDSKNLLLQMSDAFPEPEITFDQIDMNANWSSQQDNRVLVTLNKFNGTQKNGEQKIDTHFYGSYLFSRQPNSDNQSKLLKGTADLTGTISHVDLNKISRYLPPNTAPDLRHWLTNGLLDGRAENISVRIKGNLTDLPFVKQGLLDQNIFHITGKIVDGKINYLPGDFAKDGVNPYWPILSKINGQIVFDRESMDIRAESGVTDGVPVANIHARVPDVLSPNLMLEIDGTASGKAQDMLHYVSMSPVLEWIGNFTQDTKMTGNAKLNLHLAIPLSNPLKTVVAGEVQFNNNDVVLFKELPLLTRVNGRLNFDENGLSLNTLKGNFLGGPVTVTGGTRKDGVIRINAEGSITADGLRQAYDTPTLKNIVKHIDGKTLYTTVVQIKNRQTEVWVDSNLQGMSLRLPAPFNKAAAEKMPLHVEIINAPTNANTSKNTSKGTQEYDELKLSLGSLINAQYFRERDTMTSPWKILRGGIGVNAPAPTPDSGLSAHIDLASVNVDDLQSLLSDQSKQPVTNDTVSNTGRSASTTDLRQYIEPDLLSVHATELTLMGKKLNQVVLGATRSHGVWQANLDSKQISGYLTWNATNQGSGHVTARLGSLIITDTAASDVVDLLQNQKVHSSIPGLDVIADSVELFGKKLGRLELQAKNVNAKNDQAINEWQIESLSLSNADAVLTAKGKWSNGGNSGNKGRNQTELSYQLAINDAGKLLDRMGYPRLIAGGKGKLAGEINWFGSPYSMDIPTLSGKLQLELHAGQFLKVDPGAAKLLAVLNLQTLPRRLILDFRDVFSEGFAFDAITGNADIENGVAKTDNFKMHSNSATVLLSGSANITNETQDLHVIVVPEVNAGAASVLYGLAVNPVIGAGTFLAQLFLRHPLMKAFTFEYRITGPWKEPDVVKLSGKNQKTE